VIQQKAILPALLLVVVFLAGAGASWGRPQNDMPRIMNAKQETRAVAQSLNATVSQTASESNNPGWIGYSVGEVQGEGLVCCGNSRWDGDRGTCGTCALENNHDGFNMHGEDRTVRLESGDRLVVLLRVADKRVMRIRLASTDCTLDAGGLRFVWLTAVKPEESVTLLASFVRHEDFAGKGDHAISGQALAAIALHANLSADRALAAFVAPEQPEELRRQTAFWLGSARGKPGLAILQGMARNEASSDVRAHVTFALSVSKEPAAMEEMIRMAREDESSHVRWQALFWLAQKAGKKASAAITGAIENDPDTEVKKKAVFALSQMPKDEGVPKLIEVAQTNKNREVRKQAMFWLGQSNDPRALAFFEKVLSQ
jgi:hypothetical protein